MKKGLLIALGLTLAAAVVGAVMLALPALNQGKGAPAAGDSLRTVEGGGVTVQAELLPPSGQGLEFRIVMDTHSVDLKQFDLSKLSRVVLGSGQALTDVTWKSEGDSHHLKGALLFRDAQGLAAGAGTITLEITGLPGGEIRRFEWQGAAR